LVGAWRFDPHTGLLLPDFAYANHAEIDGPAWITEQFGPALDFDGADDRVRVPDAPHLNLSTHGTLEVFARPGIPEPDDVGGTTFYRGLITKNSGGAAGTTSYSLSWRGKNVSSDLYLILSNGAAFSSTQRAIGALDITQYYHFAATWDTSEAWVYLNGQRVGAVGPTAAVQTLAIDVSIGGRTFGAAGNYFWNGPIAEARIYRRTLSPHEIYARFEKCLKRANPMANVWTMPWGAITALPRIPRRPAAYSTPAIY
jgi:hypothetical protein